MTLHVNGFWLEGQARARDPAFADALGRGLARFTSFIGACKVEIDTIAPKKLREHVRKFITH